MIKKVILMLIIVITLIAFIIPKSLAINEVNIPQSATDQKEAFNGLLNGEATVTSDDDESDIQSEVVGIGVSDSQVATMVGGITSPISLIASAINKLLAAVALGGNANMDDYTELSDYFTIGDLLTNKYPLFNINMFEPTPTGPNSDISNTLKDNTAIWYVAVRNIAVAGCAITLFYVGIRMAISSTAEDSAKYKKMLMSWLIGAILLFLIHFIILLMIKVTEIFVKFVSDAVTNNNDLTEMEIAMLTGLPDSIKKAEGWEKLLYLVLNFVMVYYEIKFFIMYLFRVLKVFILTIISPLICISYPIDAMGDGKAQAFNNWIKRLILDILIQPIHLVIYIVFIYSAGAIAATVPALGILFLIALDNAERIVKNTFNIKGKGLRDIKIIPGKGK